MAVATISKSISNKKRCLTSPDFPLPGMAARVCTMQTIVDIKPIRAKSCLISLLYIFHTNQIGIPMRTKARSYPIGGFFDPPTQL